MSAAMIPPGVGQKPKMNVAIWRYLITRLFDHWDLGTRDCLMLLGLSPGNRAALAGYRKGKPLANSRDLFDRVSYLLGIHKALRLIFPKNRDLAPLDGHAQSASRRSIAGRVCAC